MGQANFDTQRARSATTLEEAQTSLREFIREGLSPDSPHHIHEHSQGYDLFLPWFMEVIEYVPPLEDKEPLTIHELQRLYLDAAWIMVTKGVLRPGPPAMSGAGDHSVYGRAFSVMIGTEI